MQIRVDITKDDYWEFNKYFILHDKKAKLTFILGILSIPILVFIIEILMHLPLPLIIISSIASGFVGYYAMMRATKKQVLGYLDRRNGLLGEHFIEITPDGIKEKTNVNESTHLWKGAANVVMNNKYIYVFINNLTAHIIPIRSFSSEDEAKEFYNLSLSYFKENLE